MGLRQRCDVDHARVKARRAIRRLRMPVVLVKAPRHKLGIKGNEMAGNGDMKAHRETYDSVMSLLKWGSVGVFIIGAIVVVLIGS